MTRINIDQIKPTLFFTLLVVAACAGGSSSTDPILGGTSGGGTSGGPSGTSGGTSGTTSGGTSGTTSGGTSGATSGGPPRRLIINTTWTQVDAEQTRPLGSDTDDCFAAGFNLKAVVALLPKERDDTLRTDEVGKGGGWTQVKEEPVRVTLAHGTDLGKATCSAPVKGWCPTSGEAPCRTETLPTIRVEGTTVTWSMSNATPPTSFTSELVATPETVTITSNNRMPTPPGWTSWVEYTVILDADGFGGTMNDTGCSPCTNHIQRYAGFPPTRSISGRR